MSRMQTEGRPDRSCLWIDYRLRENGVGWGKMTAACKMCGLSKRKDGVVSNGHSEGCRFGGQDGKARFIFGT